METKIKLMIVILIVVVAAGIIFFALPKKNVEQTAVFPTAVPSLPTPSPEPGAVATESLGGEIFEKSQNPMENNVPQVNPFEAKTNPFKSSYTNPFAE